MHGPRCKFGASSEFRSSFIEAHGVRGAAFGKVRAAGDDSSIFKVNFQKRCHFVEACTLSLRVHIEVDAANHLLHVRTLDHMIGELAESRLPAQKKYCHAKLHAELGFQSGLGPVMK